MHETNSLKTVASNALERLERNKPRNKIGTKASNSVSGPILCETKPEPVLLQLSSLQDEYEERLAIAEYDGHQNPTQAQRIAYQDAFIAVLNTLPYEETHEGDWVDQRIKAAKDWLVSQGIEVPR